MERIFSDTDSPSPQMAWANWDFYPSPWNGGTLLGNCIDDPAKPFVGVAAPGVSLCGETGFETARWRRAEWPTVRAFLNHGEPKSFEVMDLGCVREHLPNDFSEWAARSTVAHIERLRSLSCNRPGQSEAASLVDALCMEMDEACPGTLERLLADYEVPTFATPRRRRSLHLQLLERFPALQMSRMQVLGLMGQIVCFLAVYALYRLVRGPQVPAGTEIGFQQVIHLPVSELVIWLYGFSHVAVPAAFFGWLYLCRHAFFATARNTVILASVITVTAYVVYEPASVYAVGMAESVPSGALPTMPAFHLVVALGMAIFGIKLSRSVAAKLFWAAYPVAVASILTMGGSRYLVETIAFATGVTLASLFMTRSLIPDLQLPIDAIGGKRRRAPMEVIGSPVGKSEMSHPH